MSPKINMFAIFVCILTRRPGIVSKEGSEDEKQAVSLSVNQELLAEKQRTQLGTGPDAPQSDSGYSLSPGIPRADSTQVPPYPNKTAPGTVANSHTYTQC